MLWLVRIARILLVLALLLATALMLDPRPGEPPAFAHIDKLKHLFAFAILGFLAHASWPALDYLKFKALPLLAYGLTIECIQLAIPTRSFDWLDLLADGLGLLLAGLAARLLWPCNIPA